MEGSELFVVGVKGTSENFDQIQGMITFKFYERMLNFLLNSRCDLHAAN